MHDLMSTRQAAELLDVSTPTVTRWVATGYITAAQKFPHRNGGFLFERAEVERIAAARAAAA